MPTAIQFLRSDTPELRPNPVTLSDGMPMVNTNETEPGLFFKARDGSIIKVGPCAVSDEPPNSNPQGFEGVGLGEMWLDTSRAGFPQLRVWTGSAWSGGNFVTDNSNQTISGQKTFTEVITAQGGINASGETVSAESLTLSGFATSSPTLATYDDSVLTTKGYVDTRTSSLNFSLAPGNYIAGAPFNGSTPESWDVQASSANEADKIVARDSNGYFVASSASFFGLLVSDRLQASDLCFSGRLGGVEKLSLKADGSATFAGTVTASNISSFRSTLETEAASATTIAALRTAILNALANL